MMRRSGCAQLSCQGEAIRTLSIAERLAFLP